MKALTLIQPWATAVALWGKPIENRTWAPPRSLVGQRIAIHAGKQFDAEAWWTIEDATGRDEDTLLDGRPVPHGAVVATARLLAPIRESASPWFCGPVGWPLADVIALPEPVPCRGAQGLWPLPPDVEARVLEQEARATKAEGHTGAAPQGGES